MTCPKCKREVRIVRYGFGYVGLYNEEKKCEDEEYYKKYYREVTK